MLLWFRRRLRDRPWARALVIRLLAWVRPAIPREEDAASVLFLSYHDMCADEQKSFVAQLQLLREFGDFVGPTAALAHLAAGTGRRVCLTFDDGHLGAFEHALPVLAREGIPAGFFIVTAWVDERRSGTVGWDECRQLAQAGMEIGSHSLSHRRLFDLAPADVVRELAHSRLRIEAETGAVCRHFACPWGQPNLDYDPARDPVIAREAGYDSFMTTVQKRARQGIDVWSLPRIRMEPSWGAAELRYAFSR